MSSTGHLILSAFVLFCVWHWNILGAGYVAEAIIVPASFSLTHKTSFHSHLSLDSLLKLLSSYEIDAHVEVVLIGDAFDQTVKEDLSARLEALSALSAFASPMAFVHEKFVFHVVLGKMLEENLAKLIASTPEGSAIDPISMSQIFMDYHSKASTSTTLFIVLDSLSDYRAGGPQEGTYESGHRAVNRTRSYSYASLLPFCRQRAFIAREHGMAWLDLSASANNIQPSIRGLNVVPVPDLSNFTGDKAGLMHALAALVLRSGEALVPFPHPRFRSATFTSGGSTGFSVEENVASIPSSEFYDNRLGSSLLGQRLAQPPRRVDILVISMCVDDSETFDTLCEDDLKTLMVIEKLSRLYSSSSLLISSDTVKFNLNSEPQIAHALHASTKFSGAGGEKRITISSAEFAYWLSSSSLVRDLIARVGAGDGGSDGLTLFLPIFVLRMPPNTEAYFDENYQQTLALPFPLPSGGWGTQPHPHFEFDADAAEAAALASGLRWPSTAVVAIRTSGPASALNTVRVHPVLECDNVGLPPGDGYADDEMRHAVREAVWGISPPRFHYSATSRNIVQDFLWATPPALRRLGSKINGAESFREVRAVSRHTFIHRAEIVLRNFAELIESAAAMVPPVNTSLLLDLHEAHRAPTVAGPRGSAAKAEAQLSNMLASQPRAAKGRPGGSGTGKVQASTGLLEAFLGHLHAAASDFSHLDYNVALLELNNAEAKVRMLEQRLELIMAARTGTVTCDGPGARQSAFGTAQQGTMDSSPYFTRPMIICVSLLLGLVAGLLETRRTNFRKRR